MEIMKKAIVKECFPCLNKQLNVYPFTKNHCSILFSVILLDITARETHQYIGNISVCHYFVCYSVHVEFEDFLFPSGYV